MDLQAKTAPQPDQLDHKPVIAIAHLALQETLGLRETKETKVRTANLVNLEPMDNQDLEDLLVPLDH